MFWLKVLVLPSAACLFAFVWFANPNKEIGRDLTSPIVQAVSLSQEGLRKLQKAGVPESCLRGGTLLMIFYRTLPLSEADALTVPVDKTCPSLRVLVRDGTEIVRVL